MARSSTNVSPDMNCGIDPAEPLVIGVREHHGRSVFFAVVRDRTSGAVVLSEDGEPSESPFLDTARRLFAAGFPADRRIVMVHDGSDTIALSATIGDAASLRVTTTPRGTPTFAKFAHNDKRKPRTDDLERKPHPGPNFEDNAPAGLRLSGPRQTNRHSRSETRPNRSRAA
jgi:hypothetical protein